jgi:transcription elongation factor SPT6
VEDLRSTHQFLNILAAEANNVVTVSITLSRRRKNNFENELSSTFVSDSFSDMVNAWTIDQHILPHGAKWTREWLQEEVEDLLSRRCGDSLREEGRFIYATRQSLSKKFW